MKTSYNCSNCDYSTPKWLGCCPGCKEWNSFEEKELVKETNSKKKNPFAVKMVNMSEIISEKQERIFSDISEWDRVMGGGIVPGSFLLITGDPGIGKSTLLLQVANKFSEQCKVFYFSSEESLKQIQSRVQRVLNNENNIYFCNEGNLDSIIETIKQEKPNFVIIDSIQNCYFTNANSLPGSMSQLKEAGFELMKLAKENNITIVVTGHITKDGIVAGPKTLEHIVDGVFYLQAEDKWDLRILRSVKNRFGSISEVGFFDMNQNGLNDISDINEKLLEQVTYSPGTALTISVEGSRPLIVELQALTVQSKFSTPQRVISGLDYKKVILIAAILEKYLKIKLSTFDIFFKTSEGIKITSNSSDLAIALSLLSSYFQKPVPENSIAIGEINLTGKIKGIKQTTSYLQEINRFGIKTLFCAKKQENLTTKISLVKFDNVYELLNVFDD